MAKTLAIIFFLPVVLLAANEIRTFQTSGNTYFAVIREVDGDVWHIVDEVFEHWGTDGNDADDYDIPLTDCNGGMFIANFDTAVSEGFYYVVIHQQAGGNPADSDVVVDNEYGYWDATYWHTNTTWDLPISEYSRESSFGGEVQSLDPNITTIVADTNELQEDWVNGGRLDLLIDAIKAATDLMRCEITTVSDANDANSFTVTAGPTTTDAYLGHPITVTDANDGHFETRLITYWSSARVVEVDMPFSFTPAVSDAVTIWTNGYWGELFEDIERGELILHIVDRRE